MSTYKVKRGQNIYDVAIDLYGSVEGVFDLLITNDWLDMDTEFQGGEELSYHSNFVVNDTITKTLSNDKVTPVNGERGVYYKETNLPVKFIYDIAPDVTSVYFSAAGNGSMIIDWGDNTELETVKLNDSIQTVEHYFNNNVDSTRRIKVYGDFTFQYLNTTGIPGDILPVAEIVVDEYVNRNNTLVTTGIGLFKGTYSIDLNGSYVYSLAGLYDLDELYDIDFTGVQFDRETELEEFLQNLITSYNGNVPGKICIDEVTSDHCLELIEEILSNEEMNKNGQWKIYVGGDLYVKQ